MSWREKLTLIALIACRLYNVSAYNENQMQTYLNKVLREEAQMSDKELEQHGVQCTVIPLAPIITTYVDMHELGPGQRVDSGTLIKYSCYPGKVPTPGSILWDNCDEGIWQNSIKKLTAIDWMKTLFECRTNNGECAAPAIPLSNMKAVYSKQLLFHNGTALDIVCQEQALRAGNTTILCVDGEWVAEGDVQDLCQPPQSVSKNKKKLRIENDLSESLEMDCTTPYVPGGMTFFENEEKEISMVLDKFYNVRFHHNDLIRVVCYRSGRDPVLGDNFLSCSNGMWVALRGWPSCLAPCTVIEVPDAVSDVPVGRSVRHGHSVRYVCSDGLTFSSMQRSTTAKCVDGRWRIAVDQYSCKPSSEIHLEHALEKYEHDDQSEGHRDAMFGAPCFTPLIAHSRDTLSHLIRHGDVYQLQCVRGYRLRGPIWIKCRHGEWTFRGGRWPKCLLSHSIEQYI